MRGSLADSLVLGELVFLILALAITMFVVSLLIAGVRGTWYYWHRGTPLAHVTITVLSVVSLLLVAASFLFDRQRRGLLVAAFGIGPSVILLHMLWTWLRYEGPPQEFARLPKPLDAVDGLVTALGQSAARVVFKEDDIEPEAQDLPAVHGTAWYRWSLGLSGVALLGLSVAAIYRGLQHPPWVFEGIIAAVALVGAVVFFWDAVTGRIPPWMKRWVDSSG